MRVKNVIELIRMSKKNSIEEKNLVNLILYFEVELRLVLEGASVVEVFNGYEQKRLRNKGILAFRNQDWFITEKTRNVLKRKDV